MGHRVGLLASFFSGLALGALSISLLRGEVGGLFLFVAGICLWAFVGETIGNSVNEPWKWFNPPKLRRGRKGR